jgi:hypothetical protein
LRFFFGGAVTVTVYVSVVGFRVALPGETAVIWHEPADGA